MPFRRHHRLFPAGVCLALAFLTFAAFWPAHLNDFVEYDDQDYLTKNPVVQRGLTTEGIKWAFTTGHASNWHPITWLSHMADVEMFGMNPSGHHLVSVGLHAVNGVLLLVALFRSTGQLWPSALAAALFALHPLRVESVAWAAERKDVLSGLFFLLTLLAYVHYARSKLETVHPRQIKGSIWYFAALAFFALGLMSKPMLVTVPFLLLLLDYWPLGRIRMSMLDRKEGTLIPPIRPAPGERERQGWTGILGDKIPFLALSIFSSLVTLQVQEQAKLHFQNLTLMERAANALVSYVRYVGKVFWPSDLAVLYPHPGSWPAGSVILAAATIVSITVAMVWRIRTWPWLAVGWFWFLGMLVPVIGFVQVGVQSIADRYTYLPAIGIGIAISWTAALLWRRSSLLKGVLLMLATFLLAGSVAGVRRQVRVWRDTETLFSHALSVTSGNWVAHANLGAEALRKYQELKIAGEGEPAKKPNEQQELLHAVVHHCSKALEMQPGFVDAHVMLSKALIQLGQLERARRHLEIALNIAPDEAEAHQNLAEIFYRQGNIQLAVTGYRKALKSRPNWDAVMNNLAWILSTTHFDHIRNGAEAVRLAEKASTSVSHTNLSFLHTLAAAYAENGKFDDAEQTAQQALVLAMAGEQPAEIEKAAERLALYRDRKPLRSGGR